jgi:hypothetical protein
VIVPPIVVFEGLDASFFRTKEAVEEHFEAPLPGNDGYVAFDSEGRKLELASRGAGTALSAKEADPSGAGELVDLLRDWLPLAGEPLADLQPLSLDELVSHAIVLAGYTG